MPVQDLDKLVVEMDSLNMGVMVNLSGFRGKYLEWSLDNVKNNFYGTSALEPTGPKLLSHFFTSVEKGQFDVKHDFFESHEHRVIFFNNKIILKSYEGYLLEHENHKKVPHYSVLWNRRLIYRR